MNRNKSRRCLTEIDVMYHSQVWVGPAYWMLRTKLWRRAALAVPDRIVSKQLLKSTLNRVVGEQVGVPIAGRLLPGRFTSTDGLTLVAIAPNEPLREWQAIGVQESWFVGINEIVSATAEDLRVPWSMQVNLHSVSVSWRHDDQTVAVLKGVASKLIRESEAV